MNNSVIYGMRNYNSSVARLSTYWFKLRESMSRLFEAVGTEIPDRYNLSKLSKKVYIICFIFKQKGKIFMIAEFAGIY